MSEELRNAYQMVVDDLDRQMQEAPNRELADVSNYLQARLDEE